MRVFPQPKNTEMGIYLVQQPIGTIHCHSQDTLLAGKAAGGGDGGLAIVALASLGNNGIDLGPVGAGGLVEGGAEQPVALWVAEEQGNRLASDVEVGGIVRGDIKSDTAAR